MSRATSTRRTLAAAILMPAVLSVAACGDASAGAEAAAPLDAAALDCPVPEGPVVVAAAARANAPAPKVTGKVATVLNHAIDREQHVSVLDTDAAPQLLGERSLQLESKNDHAMVSEKRQLLGQVTVSLTAGNVDQPEADPLAALDTAARTVHGRAEVGTVVLVDSGLQTSGALRYQSGDLLLASGLDVVGHLRSTEQLPDLSGLTVVLTGLGDTAAPQQRLDTASRDRLVEQWSAIAEAAGAGCVEVDTEPLTGTPPAGLPVVTTVKVPKPAQPQLDVRQPVALREDSVGFQDNSDELRDAVAAKAALQPMAAEILEGQHRVLLVGTTATAGTEDGRRALSSARAERVKELLVELGVPTDRITTRGVGTHHPQHVDDIDAEGNSIPEAAVKNRAVFVELRH